MKNQHQQSAKTLQMTATPTIHLNGTGAETLYAEYNAVRDALTKARKALEDATCNARDFYVQGDTAYAAAKAERTKMLQKLDELCDYAAAWETVALDAIEARRGSR